MIAKLALYKALDRLLSSFVRVMPRKSINAGNTPKRILVIKLSAMGDSLCLFPSVRLLSQAFPNAQIEWLASERANPNLFKSLPFLGAIHVLPNSVLQVVFYLLSFMAKASKYDLIVDYDQYYRISELISAFGNLNAGFEAPLKGGSFAVSVHYEPLLNEKLMFLKLTESVIRTYGQSPAPYNFQLPELLTNFSPSLQLVNFAKKIELYDIPILAIYPGSGKNASFRRWPANNYVSLIKKIKKKYTILIIGGMDEVELIPYFEGIDGVYLTIGQFTLMELVWLFRNVIDIFAGNDGGLLHIAESQSTPVVGIFGPALFQKWGSINPHSEAVEYALPCRPCLRNYQGIVPNNCIYSTVECLTAIKPSQVELALSRVNKSSVNKVIPK